MRIMHIRYTFIILANNVNFISKEGGAINKLQNSVILLILDYENSENIHFVKDLILSMSSYEFYYDDVTVTSFINIRYGNVAVEIIP